MIDESGPRWPEKVARRRQVQASRDPHRDEFQEWVKRERADPMTEASALSDETSSAPAALPTCDRCGKTFARRGWLKRHKRGCAA